MVLPGRLSLESNEAMRRKGILSKEYCVSLMWKTFYSVIGFMVCDVYGPRNYSERENADD